MFIITRMQNRSAVKYFASGFLVIMVFAIERTLKISNARCLKAILTVKKG